MSLHPHSFTKLGAAVSRRNQAASDAALIASMAARNRRIRLARRARDVAVCNDELKRQLDSLESGKQFAIATRIRSKVSDPTRYSRNGLGKSYAELVEETERELGFQAKPKGDLNARVRDRIEYYSRRNQWKPYAEIVAEVEGK